MQQGEAKEDTKMVCFKTKKNKMNGFYFCFFFFFFRYYSVTGRPMRGQSMALSTSNPTRTTHTGSEKSVTNETILLTNNGHNN